MIVIRRCSGDVNLLLNHLQRFLGCGGTVQAAGGGTIELQGGGAKHFALVCSWLVERRVVHGLSTQSSERILSAVVQSQGASSKSRASTSCMPNSAKARALAALARLQGSRSDVVSVTDAGSSNARRRLKPRHVIRNADGTGRKLPSADARWLRACQNARCTWVYCSGECLAKPRKRRCDDMSDVFWVDERFEATSAADPKQDRTSTSSPAAAFDRAAVEASLEAMGLLAMPAKIQRRDPAVVVARSTHSSSSGKRHGGSDRGNGKPWQKNSATTARSWHGRGERGPFGGSAEANRTRNIKPKLRVHDHAAGHFDGYSTADFENDGYSAWADDDCEADAVAAASAAAAAWRDELNRRQSEAVERAAKASRKADLNDGSPAVRIVRLRKRTPDEIAEAARRKRLGAGRAARGSYVTYEYQRQQNLQNLQQRMVDGAEGVERSNLSHDNPNSNNGTKRLDEMDDSEVFFKAVKIGAVDRHMPTVRAVLGDAETVFSWRAFLSRLPRFQPDAAPKVNSNHESDEAEALAAELGASLDRVADGQDTSTAALPAVQGIVESSLDHLDHGAHCNEAEGSEDESFTDEEPRDDSRSPDESEDDKLHGETLCLEESATTLVLMGFDEDATWEALADAKGDLEGALMLLLAADSACGSSDGEIDSEIDSDTESSPGVRASITSVWDPQDFHVTNEAALQTALSTICPGLDAAVVQYLCEVTTSMAMAGDPPGAAAAAIYSLVKDSDGWVGTQLQVEDLVSTMFSSNAKPCIAETQTKGVVETSMARLARGVQPHADQVPTLMQRHIEAAEAGAAVLAQQQVHGRGRGRRAGAAPVEAVSRAGRAKGRGRGQSARGRGRRRTSTSSVSLPNHAGSESTPCIEEAIQAMMALGFSRDNAIVAVSGSRQ